MPISAILALLPTLISSVGEGYTLIQKITEAAKQSGELTPEQEAQLDAHIADLESKPWWQPDATN